MKIEQEKYVEIEYTLKDKTGKVIDSTEGRPAFSFIHGMGELILGLEEALEGKQKGETLSVTIPAEKGYGPYRQEMVEEVPLSEFESIPNLHEGMQLQAHTSHGVRVYTIKEIKESSAIIDGNHPLAGEDLNFEVKINEVRAATQEELHPPMAGGSCCSSGGGHHHEHSHGGGGGCGTGGCGCG